MDGAHNLLACWPRLKQAFVQGHHLRGLGGCRPQGKKKEKKKEKRKKRKKEEKIEKKRKKKDGNYE